jgi:excisionase family DNA binding protein
MKTPRKPAPRAAKPGDDLLGMDEAIAMLKTTRPTFYRWLKTGKLKGMKVGRQWRFYKNDVEGFLRGEGLRYDLPVGVEPLINTLYAKIGEKGAPVSSLSDAEKLALAADLVVRVGTTLKASDIHLDTLKDSGRLRYRVNGILAGVAEFDAKLMPALVTRFKVMGKCAVDVHNVPQDARIPYQAGGIELDLLMSFLPSMGGETLTMRLLDRSITNLTLDHFMGANPLKEALVSGLSAPYGLVIVSGPTGSGKTSILYACVNHLAVPEKKVVSIEDPVEYLMPGVVQVGVNKSAGLTAANALRAVLRSDPNIIVVGEIKDAETADLACKAALTGHLVVSSMHARNSGHVISRLIDMGVDPYTLGETLLMVTSQRLVRKVCKDCGTKDAPSAKALADAQEAASTGGLDWKAVGNSFRKQVGCPKCNQTGYKGRAMAMELMKVDREIAAAIRAGDGEKVRAKAVSKGMVTIEAEAVRLAGEGTTTIGEAQRVMD